MSALLEVKGLEAGYGAARVLFGVDLALREGEALALMGRNGMGKTTTVRAIMGLLPPTGGRVAVAGQDLTGAAPHRVARAGLGLVPEGRQVFPTLSVIENLRATARPGPWTVERALALFPRLAERRRHRGAQLSGGEQQMLAIARALLTNPRLLVLDEATEGLAPLIRAEIWRTLGALKQDGLAVLVIDKDLSALGRLAEHALVLERGEVVWRGTGADLRADPEAVERRLHL